MRNHYEVLGVPASAGHDDLREAYTARAFELGPDLSSGDEAATANAAFKMDELNAAWDVLRDTARRAAYDREVAGGPASSPAADGARLPPGMAEAAVIGSDAPVSPRTRFRRWAPVAVLAALLVLLVTVAVLATPEPEPQPDLETTAKYPVGSCVLVAGESVAASPCDAPEAIEVVARANFPRPCPPRTRAFVLSDEGFSICFER